MATLSHRPTDRPVHRRVQRSASGALLLRAPILARIPWLVHGFTTRVGGVSGSSPQSKNRARDLNLGYVAWDEPENVNENRRRLRQALEASTMTLVVQNQIHSDLIRVIEDSNLSSSKAKGDALITRTPGLLLAVLAADCFPVLLVDVRQRVVAAMHCGWRGTARRIAEKGVGRMRLLFGSRPEDLRAAIGPGIRSCCYRIGDEVAAEFESQFLYADKLLRIHRPHKYFVDKKYALMRAERWRASQVSDGRVIYLDLVDANLRQLEAAGIRREYMDVDFPCTHCHPDLFFSHRRDAARAGRMMGVIGIRN